MIQALHRRIILFAFALATLLLPHLSLAGTLDQGFADRMARTPRDSFLKGLVMMSEQPDLGAVNRRIATLGATSRWRRHQIVVTEARGLAARTQVDLIHTLKTLESTGSVRSFRPFWVTNMIAVEARPEVFDRLLARDDVGTIFENTQLELREAWPEEETVNKAPTTLPDNLVCVNVQPAWDAGLHGEGRLVADFDTGADGYHPALASRWRGAQPRVDWTWAWKDPYTGTPFPYDHAIHGTHTLGIMVGQKPDGTPIGVAPGAQWIAAGILIGWDVEKIIDCYEWAVDPDGDPGTIGDVPDVINNSWGTSGNCDQTFWNAIDLVEAAGIVNTIAVDNTGPYPMSVNSPESRAASATVNWGVGNVNPHLAGYPIAGSSGRGPSPCDSVSIKPEVTAPGTQIYSTLPGSAYGSLTGTSMACPHTSGAVAILRQVNPDLSVEEVKTALMVTAVDKGTAGEDNDYGWGIIDIGAAVAYVTSTLPMDPPQGLAAQLAGRDVFLNWSVPLHRYPTSPVQAYRIYRTTVGVPYPLTPIAQVAPATLPSYTDHDVPYEDYHYVVTAVYAIGESGPSNEIEVDIIAPPMPPRDLTVAASGDTVQLSWLAPDSVYPNNPVLLYRVYRAALADTFPPDPIVETPDSVRTYMDVGRPIGADHYMVTALFANGESGPSNEVGIRIYDPAAVTASPLASRLSLLVSPNPFGATTTFRYRSASSGPMAITIYDPSGARVRTLMDRTVVAGSEGSVVWDGKDAAGRAAASGSYFVHVEQPGISLNRRVTLLR